MTAMEQKKRIKSEDGRGEEQGEAGRDAANESMGISYRSDRFTQPLAVETPGEERNMVMGVSHPALSRVIGTNGKIESWLNRGRTGWSSCCCRWQKRIL